MTSIPQQYFEWYYNANIWKTLTYRGVRILKYPMDLWNYQEIISERNVQWVLETGTRHGGSALFFADLLSNLDRSGKVVTIDVEPELRVDLRRHPRVDLIIGDSGSAEVIDRAWRDLQRTAPGEVFVILDSDHRKPHVLRELDAIVPRMRTGDYLVVEDTVVNGHPVRPDHGPGPLEAVGAFVASRPGLLAADHRREARFGFSAAQGGYFMRANEVPVGDR
jgi:cephalosporin hydroxylase